MDRRKYKKKGSTGDKTFTAEWTKATYGITYVLNDGENNTNNPTGYDIESETITLFNPTRDGYTFVKWTEGNTIAKGSIGNKTFTAEWTKATYEITYVLNDGENNTNNPTGYNIESETITLFNPTKNGYTFVKWTEGNTITKGSIGNKTFTAEWTKATYEITYVLNNGENNINNPTGYDIESETITLFNPTKIGYTFVKWTEGNTITKGSTGDKTFTAEWIKATYGITYVLNDGENNTNNPMDYDIESETITLFNPTKIGYTFVKWTEGNTIPKGSTGNKTFTAEWAKATYGITYVLNDGENNTNNPTDYDIESETITLFNPTKIGYTFVKWTEGNTIAKGSTGNKTFTAEWTLISYDIEYTLNGGTQNASNLTEYTIASENIVLSEPTYTGYKFGGWFDNDECSGTAITNISKGTMGNKHFYAKWNDIFTKSGTTITGLTEIGNTLSDMTIPSGFTAIANNAFMNKTNITKFVIPAEITSIGVSAFSGCTNLETVVLNSGLETIGDSAFVKCAFANIIIPSTVTSVGDSVLEGCANLIELTIPYTGTTANATAVAGAQNFGKIFGGTLYDAPEFVLCQSYSANGSTTNYYVPAGLKTINFNTNFTTIKSNAFRNCTMIEVVRMPNSVETIDDGAFYGCTNLKSFTLPSSLTIIGDTSFQNCTSLTTLTTPNGVTNIKPNAFKGCINLDTVTLNQNLLTIGSNAFAECDFTTFTVPSTVSSIGEGVLGGCSKLIELTIPYTGATATSTPSGGAQNFGRIFGTFDYDKDTANDFFKLCPSLNSYGAEIKYQIPNSLKTVRLNSNIFEIKSNAFRNCTMLEVVNMPNSVETIDDGAFYGCTNLKSFTLPNSLTIIGDTSFQNCTSLITLTTPNGVTNIKPNAFKGCTNLATVTLNENLLTIGNNAFAECDFTTFTVPSTVSSIGEGVLGGCSKLIELTIPYTGATATSTSSGGAQNFGRIFGTFDYDKDTANDFFKLCPSLNYYGAEIKYQIPNSLKTVRLNSNILEIKSNVFRNCTMIETICLPSTITKISNEAFNGCSSLTSIVIPVGVSTIDNSAFGGCSSLLTITLQSQQVVTSIADSGIMSIGTTIYVPANLLNNYKLTYPTYASTFVAIQE